MSKTKGSNQLPKKGRKKERNDTRIGIMKRIRIRFPTPTDKLTQDAIQEKGVSTKTPNMHGTQNTENHQIYP